MRGHNVLQRASHLPSPPPQSVDEVYANDQRVNYSGHELWPRLFSLEPDGHLSLMHRMQRDPIS